MDYYIVQKEEIEIDAGMANRLVDFLVLNLGIPRIDAQIQIKHFPGIIKISGEEEVRNLSQDFRAAGLDNFIIEEKDFVPLPGRSKIAWSQENAIERPGLIAAGIICKKTEQSVKQWNPLHVKAFFTFPIIYDNGVSENRKTNEQTTFYIDIITREKRWEISRPEFPDKEIRKLEKLDLLNTYLSSDMRKLFQKQTNIKAFTERKYYNEYLTWLMQVVYAKRNKDSEP